MGFIMLYVRIQTSDEMLQAAEPEALPLAGAVNVAM